MARACRQNHHVVRLELQCASLRAAKPDSGVPARNAEHFMNPEVAMRVFVNAIPPESSQPLRSNFEHCRRIEFARKPDGAPIEHEGQLWIVGEDAIVLELESICFPWPQGRIEIAGGRAGPARDFLEPLLNAFQKGHDCTGARL
jgi:hypothetical protein